MVSKFKQGDIIALDFDPSKGSEQKGRRPALVISNDIHNSKQKMIFVCPITSTNRNYPTHLQLSDDTTTIKGSVMIEQMRAIDQTSAFRNATKIDAVTPAFMHQVLTIMKALL